LTLLAILLPCGLYAALLWVGLFVRASVKRKPLPPGVRSLDERRSGKGDHG
jgi:hypothetical protein